MDIVNDTITPSTISSRICPRIPAPPDVPPLWSFGVKSRFVHFEFFRMTEISQHGQKGQLVALEVNTRPCGGFTPDMINFARSTNVQARSGQI